MKLKVVTLIWMENTKDFLFMELVEQWNKCNNRYKIQSGGPKDMIVMVSSTLNSNLELALSEVPYLFLYWSLGTYLLISSKSKHQLNFVLFLCTAITY